MSDVLNKQVNDYRKLEENYGSIKNELSDAKQDLLKITQANAEIEKKMHTIGEQAKEAVTKIEETEGKSMQIIGMLTSVIALILVFIQISTSITNIFWAYLILLMSCSALVIFASLLHIFFSIKPKEIAYKLVIGAICLIISIGVYLCYLFYNPINQEGPHDPEIRTLPDGAIRLN